jgi:transcriptional regulator with XRE-family HTH domain
VRDNKKMKLLSISMSNSSYNNQDTEAGAKVELSNKLKHYRRIHNLSQEGLAEASGISIRTIQRIENAESVGSAYTLNALAGALHINAKDLLSWESRENSLPYSGSTRQLKLLNLSALLVLIVPFANLIAPAFIFFKNKKDEAVSKQGRKILSFQILFSLTTILAMVILPVLLLIIPVFRANRIPLFIPIYFIAVFFNIYFTIRFAICINNHTSFLKNFPNIL